MWTCFIKKKSVLWRKMNEARAVNKMEVNLPQEKINFINDAHHKELQYENERKQLTDIAPLRVFWLVRLL